VEAGANNILGVENVLTYESLEDGVFNQADIALFDRKGYELFIDFDILLQLALELEAHSRHRKVLIYVLNQVVNAYGAGSDDENSGMHQTFWSLSSTSQPMQAV
jgi:polyhydroxyalkanoate synthesis regulator protein